MGVDIDFLRELCTAHGVSGYEEAAQAVVCRRLAATAEPIADALGNVLATVGAQARPHVVVASHCDQIGLIVTGVDEKGFITVDAVGLVDPRLPEGREFIILSERGPVPAVGAKVAIHLASRGASAAADDIRDHRLDIGARDRREALSRVSPGDPVIVKPSFFELSPELIAGQALDNRAGVYIAVRAAELYASRPGGARLDVLTTVCEETTKLGAKGQAMALRPDCTIVIDVEHASDQPGVDPGRYPAVCQLGGGPVLERGSCSNKALFTLARRVAGEEGIPVQVVASTSPTYTDSDELQCWPACANLNIGIPLRYMHSPLEVCSGSDLEHAAALLAALTRRLGEVWQEGLFTAAPSRDLA